VTSRIRPAGLDPAVVVLPIHALSRDETVLLARELPNLSRLLHADGSNLRAAGGAAVTAEKVEHDRNLVRRTLTVVQGHPKLLELADAAAADPDTLTVHLDAAENAAGGAGRLAAFLTHGDSALDPKGFLTVLEGWTNSTLDTLPESARTLMQALCAIEDDDRISAIIEWVWPELWRVLYPDTDLPDLDQTIGLLAAAALIHPEPSPTISSETPMRYRIHPGIAGTVYATTPDTFITATRQTMAGFWHAVFKQATGGRAGENTSVVVRAGLAAAPYLLAMHSYSTASMLLEHAVIRDDTPATVHAALPHLRHIVGATDRTADIGILAGVLARVDPSEAEHLMRDALERAGAEDDHRLASGIAGDLINLLRNAGRLAEALDLADTKAELTHRAGLGPWTQLLDQGTRLQILYRMGDLDEVLNQVHELRDRMAQLSDPPGDDETVQPWNVRETVLNLGTLAANDLRQYQTALDLAHETIASLEQRGASEYTVARVRINAYPPLRELGRLDEAEAVLLACQQVFETEQDITMLARTMNARAITASRRGHHRDAATFQRTAIRLIYIQPQPGDIASAHHNLGLGLHHGGADPGEVIAHHLAAAVLAYLIGATHNTAIWLHVLAVRLEAVPDLAPPTTLAELAAVVERVEGVRFTAVITALTGGDTELVDRALSELIHIAVTAPPPNPDLDQHLAGWEPVLAALVAAVEGDNEASDLLVQFLDQSAEHTDWAQLVDRLRRIHAGERDPTRLLPGLDDIDTAVTQRALDAIAGRVQLSAAPDESDTEQP
jgi:hypothetical protein